MKLLKPRRTFWKEFRRQIRLAITAAIGFSIAYAWRNTLFDTFQNWVSRLLDITNGHYLTEVYTSIAITAVGVALILLSSRLLREKN